MYQKFENVLPFLLNMVVNWHIVTVKFVKAPNRANDIMDWNGLNALIGLIKGFEAIPQRFKID